MTAIRFDNSSSCAAWQHAVPGMWGWLKSCKSSRHVTTSTAPSWICSTISSLLIGQPHINDYCPVPLSKCMSYKFNGTSRFNLLFLISWISSHDFQGTRNPSDGQTTTTTTVLSPFCRLTCVSWHLQLRTGGFCWRKGFLPPCPC